MLDVDVVEAPSTSTSYPIPYFSVNTSPSGTKRKRGVCHSSSSERSQSSAHSFSDTEVSASGFDNVLESSRNMSGPTIGVGSNAHPARHRQLKSAFSKEPREAHGCQRLRSLLKNPDGPAIAFTYSEEGHAVRPILCVYPHKRGGASAGALRSNRTTYGELNAFGFTPKGEEYSQMPVAKSLENFNPYNELSKAPQGRPNFAQTLPRTLDRETRTPFLTTQIIPTEIFEQICGYLSREQIKTLRLVDRAFERGVSRYLFADVVVPFSTEIYGNLAQHSFASKGCFPSNSSGDQDAASLEYATPTPTNCLTDSRKSTLDMFRGFGPHIQNFGMSFEVHREDLAHPPAKVLHQGHDTFWGIYRWPYPNYRRFQNRAGLELAADETSMMTLAFSHLKSVKSLAISLDSGLGWMSGLDLSLRAVVLARAHSIFGCSRYRTDEHVKGQRSLWNFLENCYSKAGAAEVLKSSYIFQTAADDLWLPCRNSPDSPFMALPNASTLTAGTLPNLSLDADYNDNGNGWERRYSEDRRLSSILPVRTDDDSGDSSSSSSQILNPSTEPDELDVNEISPACKSMEDLQITTDTMHSLHEKLHLISGGKSQNQRIVCVKPMNKDESETTATCPLNPVELTKSQREWLLETAWAQEAFLSSYMLAIADNRATLHNVQTFTISSLSSRHLSKLCRDDFWNSLPFLSTLEIHVIADWRDVQKNHAGVAETPSVRPSEALVNFHGLLQSIISRKRTLKSLSLGWFDGGEHAEGLFARNRLLLPAPLTPYNPVEVTDERFSNMLAIPFVEQLKLVNCWLTPNALIAFMSQHRRLQLRKLTLESVSLTAHPRFDIHHGLHQALGGIGAQGLPMGHANQLVHMPLTQLAQHAQQAGLQLPHANPQHQQQQALGNNTFFIPVAPAGNAPLAQAAPPLQQPGRREGSWPDVLRQLKTSYRQRPFKELEVSLLSCGYARLRCARFDQSALDTASLAANAPVHSQSTDLFFSKRKMGLQNTMLACSDPMHGSIVAALPDGEMDALVSLWGLEPGWPHTWLLHDEYDDEDGYGKWGCRTKEAATFDGLPIGGTGRFSGRLNFAAERSCEGQSKECD